MSKSKKNKKGSKMNENTETSFTAVTPKADLSKQMADANKLGIPAELDRKAEVTTGFVQTADDTGETAQPIH